MAFFLGDVLELLENGRDIGYGGVWHLIFEVEVDSFCCGYRDGVFALIFFYELPKSIGTKRLFKT